MSGSLSQMLNLRVIDCLIQLNEELNEIELGSHGIKKAGIFDHVLAVIPEFDLRIFQNPTGADFQALKS